MADIIVMKTSGKSAPKLDAGTPDPAKLIKGKYKTKTWNHFTGEDGSASASVQTIFYPIPSAKIRLRLINTASFVLGSLARNNLYYSWATLTLLGRAVHCNVGRPALWVFPPSA